MAKKPKLLSSIQAFKNSTTNTSQAQLLHVAFTASASHTMEWWAVCQKNAQHVLWGAVQILCFPCITHVGSARNELLWCGSASTETLSPDRHHSCLPRFMNAAHCFCCANSLVVQNGNCIVVQGLGLGYYYSNSNSVGTAIAPMVLSGNGNGLLPVLQVVYVRRCVNAAQRAGQHSHNNWVQKEACSSYNQRRREVQKTTYLDLHNIFCRQC